jgi:hypothetical protein
MLKKILAVVVAVLLVFTGFVATRPSQYRIYRSRVVQAAPAVLYAKVADFKAWDAWSPWAKLDPSMKVDFTGAPGAVGSSYHWVGNDKVGEGRMTILEAVPDRMLKIKLAFIKPWEQVTTTTFGFTPDGTGTKVAWTMTGEHDFVGKLFAVFWDMDKAVGTDFEKGLAKLDEVSKS